jgi:hypothetical protein
VTDLICQPGRWPGPRMVGPLDLMEFIRFDIGEVLRKELGAKAPLSLRLVVGNPLIGVCRYGQADSLSPRILPPDTTKVVAKKHSIS